MPALVLQNLAGVGLLTGLRHIRITDDVASARTPYLTHYVQGVRS